MLGKGELEEWNVFWGGVWNGKYQMTENKWGWKVVGNPVKNLAGDLYCTSNLKRALTPTLNCAGVFALISVLPDAGGGGLD